SRLQPYMTLGGGVIWEDPNNLDDISAIITTGGGSSWPPDITATVPGRFCCIFTDSSNASHLG
ncbi:MAG: hypothetical protein QF898_10325, partial [SAR202 cluster bacterium]|nr:hypothetical protein [SAR202 cluster bacterium]